MRRVRRPIGDSGFGSRGEEEKEKGMRELESGHPNTFFSTSSTVRPMLHAKNY